MLRLFDAHPDEKVIYIAPLKALVRERINDWTTGLCARLGKKMCELTGAWVYTLTGRCLMEARTSGLRDREGVKSSGDGEVQVKRLKARGGTHGHSMLCPRL